VVDAVAVAVAGTFEVLGVFVDALEVGFVIVMVGRDDDASPGDDAREVGMDMGMYELAGLFGVLVFGAGPITCSK